MNAEVLVAIGTIITALTTLSIGVLTHLSSAQKTALEGMQATIDNLQKENDRMARRIQALEDDKSAADECNEALEKDMRELRAQIVELQEQNAELKSIVRMLNQKIKELGGKPPTGALKIE